MTVLRGEQVLLRPVEERDHPLILAWQNDPEVWWWYGLRADVHAEEIRESETRAKVEGHPFTIELHGRPIGRIGLNQFRERDQVCSLYVFIGENDAWDGGYGSDAIVALLRRGFPRFGLHLVELWGPAANARAFHAYGRVGFSVDGTLRERSRKSDGRRYDRTIASITRDEFERLHPDQLRRNA